MLAPVERFCIPSIILFNGPGGLRKQAAEGDHLGMKESAKAANIPSAAVVNSWSTDVAETMHTVAGVDAAAPGVQVLLGPGLNAKRSPLCGRSFEYRGVKTGNNCSHSREMISMEFPAREVVLKDGRICVLRPTVPADAADMIEYLKETAGETEFLLRYPDEVTYTPEREEEILKSIHDDPRSVMMVAVVDGEIAGNCGISELGAKRKIRHRCSMGIALYEAFWHLGIGTAMIGYLTELAGQIGYEQMDLEVVAENTRAQALYRKCGFVESGRRHHALRFDDGTYHDEVLMYKTIRQGE